MIVFFLGGFAPDGPPGLAAASFAALILFVLLDADAFPLFPFTDAVAFPFADVDGPGVVEYGCEPDGWPDSIAASLRVKSDNMVVNNRVKEPNTLHVGSSSGVRSLNLMRYD